VISISRKEGSQGDMLEASLAGSLSEREAREAKSLLLSFVQESSSEHKSVKIDVSGVESVSSIVVAILLSGLRAANKHSCVLSYVNLPEYLFNMARVGGVESILAGAE
jgi:ABC-type transporter Mla MlaB component